MQVISRRLLIRHLQFRNGVFVEDRQLGRWRLDLVAFPDKRLWLRRILDHGRGRLGEGSGVRGLVVSEQIIQIVEGIAEFVGHRLSSITTSQESASPHTPVA